VFSFTAPLQTFEPIVRATEVSIYHSCKTENPVERVAIRNCLALVTITNDQTNANRSVFGNICEFLLLLWRRPGAIITLETTIQSSKAQLSVGPFFSCSHPCSKSPVTPT
jgi:hypothetical protein